MYEHRALTVLGVIGGAAAAIHVVRCVAHHVSARYSLNDAGELEIIPGLESKEARQEFRDKKLAEYGLVLTPNQQNAMEFVEGEYKCYSSKRRMSGPLAAFCHICDVVSARIWFDCPRLEHDPWNIAERISK
jgi:hypothetical protein